MKSVVITQPLARWFAVTGSWKHGGGRPLNWLLTLFGTLGIFVKSAPAGDSETSTPPRDRKPNIVFVLADDLGYGELGSFGQTKIRTPHLDRLAREGMRLTQHYSGNAVCAPSRCVLLTGRDPGTAFIRDNRSTPPEGQYPIPDSTVTLPERLEHCGYVTGAFGKWGLGGPDSEGEPTRQGVDRFYGYNCQAVAHSYYPEALWDNTSRVAINGSPIPGHAKLLASVDVSDPRSYDRFKGQQYAPDMIRDAALEFVRDHQDEPFFLYYPTIIPHVALHVPDDRLEPYLELGWNDQPLGGQKYAYTPHFTPRAAYAAMISTMDDNVGRLMSLVEELGLADNTLFVFTSDNGPTHLGDVDTDFFNSAAGLRGLKGSLYEGGIRVPTIVHMPGVVPAGTQSDYVSGFEDWMPTLLSFAGCEMDPDDQLSGVDLTSIIRGETRPPRDHLYREFPGYGGQQMIRVGNYKAIRQSLRKGRVKTELYDLAGDPNESNDLAELHPDTVRELEAKMDAVREPSELFPLPTVDFTPAPKAAKKRNAG